MATEPDSWDTEETAEAYDEAVRGGSLYRALGRRLADLLRLPPGACLLDLACGTGVSAEPALRCLGPGGRVVGADAAAAMLAVARRRHLVPNAAWVRAVPASLPFRDGCFDAAMSSAAFWHFPSPGSAFAELYRVCRPGARLALNVPAAQLADLEDLPPAPFQLALAREGERLFGRSPAPAGPVRTRSGLAELAGEAGWTLVEERTADLAVPQEELRALVEVPAIGARLYPEADAAARRRWIEAAARRIDLLEPATVRWWEALFERRGRAVRRSTRPGA
ncbi:MAG: class I SAM-dependent methyltransferase [Acidobacteria bacterium]|nr:MAG: class I SAM-dependent methyltransferase [Acidobacteriota bacterium]